MSSVNVPLLRRVMTQITRFPATHDQTMWAYRDATCGTRYCVAGWTVALRGYDLVWEDFFVDDTQSPWQEAAYVAGAGLIDCVARKELGLTDEQANNLFSPRRTLDDIWELVEEFTNGELRRADVETEVVPA